MDNKLCPLKRIVKQNKENNEYITRFGECERENCAWWTWGLFTNKDSGWCALQTLGAISNIGIN